jgi:hypothetical protein
MNPLTEWQQTLEAARNVAERAAACREVGLVEQAAKHEDRARRLKLWAAAIGCAGRRER